MPAFLVSERRRIYHSRQLPLRRGDHFDQGGDRCTRTFHDFQSSPLVGTAADKQNNSCIKTCAARECAFVIFQVQVSVIARWMR